MQHISLGELDSYSKRANVRITNVCSALGSGFCLGMSCPQSSSISSSSVVFCSSKEPEKAGKRSGEDEAWDDMLY